MKYDDILYYKNFLQKEYSVISFVYIKISDYLYNILIDELNINTKQTSQILDIFSYKYQFLYDGMYFMLDKEYKNNNSEFTTLVEVKKIHKPNNNKFAVFYIDLLSENERTIKRLLE